jgi:probable phosphomutase (TIGR03848 family)
MDRSGEPRARGTKPPPPTVVLLVRHGRTPTTGTALPGRAPGLTLSPEGRRQAEELAAQLAGLQRLAAVYASPLERARETAAPLARGRRLAVRVEPGLTDCDVGEWTGLALKELRRRPEWQAIQRHPSGFRFPDGESFIEMQARMAAALTRLVARHPGQTVVAVSHGDPIKAAVAHALGLHLDFFQRLAVAPASVSAILYAPLAPMVLAVNATGDGLAALLRR